MPDAAVVHIGENSPELIAHKLMHEIAVVEMVTFHPEPQRGYKTADRAWILKTYRECMQAVRGGRRSTD